MLTGPLFLDIVFTGLPHEPRTGTEVWAEGMGTLPGGIANLAVACARLGLQAHLATSFGDDAYGQWCADILREERIDLERSHVHTGVHTNVTVSYAHDDDRTMITHGHAMACSADELIGEVPQVAAVAMDLTKERLAERWWQRASADGAKVFADAGWDPSEAWDPQLLAPLDACYAFTPNEVEAKAYTGKDCPIVAARDLAERVPLAVVTRGDDGAVAVDSSTGEEASAPALPVAAIDPTGAGDVFISGLIVANLAGRPLAEQLAFATLASSLSVQQFGGSLAAPGWGDLVDWNERRVRGEFGEEVARRYDFLPEMLPSGTCAQVRRAEATIARLADVQSGSTRRLMQGLTSRRRRPNRRSS
ncbi:hypothetical protein BSZ39_10065 [Bowdeniella nasicola]|uniref:Carbohydrate kinase PfkB domain-containing protein n=1 Tax=Bowdeniella nasicola TaxID=208480 RepID=A0A1Q5Q0X1_9ACTO|nr:hypothetical protein BSZ39_10065 [Bowdeniella nasicola]